MREAITKYPPLERRSARGRLSYLEMVSVLGRVRLESVCLHVSKGMCVM